MIDVLEHLRELLGQTVLLPIPLGKKGPTFRGWQNTTLADTQTPAYQRRLAGCMARGGNIGVLLGPASADLHAIDIDDDELAETFLAYNPTLANTLRSRGRRGCQFWIRPKQGTKFPDEQAVYPLRTAENNEYGEWRCGGAGGAQSVICGVHPEGERYAILVDQPPVEIDFDQIKWLGPAPGWIIEDPQEEEREPRKLRGTSIIDYSERKIDNSKNLLGNRWLSRCAGGFVVAPSGHGKSTLVIQASILWACGRVAFGINPAHPLRILIVQAEDDDNDITEMSQMCDRLKLSNEEKQLVRQNTHVEWLNDVTGRSFCPVLDDFLNQFKADLVIINPYTAYQGGDLRDDELNNLFLRIELTSLMNKHNCGAIPIHHTPKTNFQNTDSYSWFDWMYTMAGGAALTNWARAILVIAPTDAPGTYRFIAAKRFEKIGWQQREYWFAHSIEDEKILWVPASADQIACGRKGKNAGPKDMLTVIPILDPTPIQKVIVAAKEKLEFGEKKVRNYLKVLIADGEVFEHSFPRPRTNPEIRYARTKQ